MAPMIPGGLSRRGLSPQGTVPSSAGTVPGLWAIVLAAGASRRFGRAKLLQRVGCETLVQRAARIGRAVAGQRCVVVLGARASRLAAELRGHGVRTVVNRRWREGMSTSLAAGIGALPPDAQAALVLLADQYAIEPAQLVRLLRAWRRRPDAIVASGWDGVRSPPVVLPRHVFGRAGMLRGDAGARELLRDSRLHVEVVPLPAASLDLDLPGDRNPAGGPRHRRTA